MDPDTINLWIRIRFLNPDLGSRSRSKKEEIEEKKRNIEERKLSLRERQEEVLQSGSLEQLEQRRKLLEEKKREI